MYIRSIQLRNWKAYPEALLEFPKPNKKKNVVLIGAQNGYGKTSLLEAILLCLYGRDAMGLLPRLSVEGKGGSDTDRISLSYDKFMQSALNAHAFQLGEATCNIQMVFEDDDDDRIKVQRTWYFEGGTSKHKPGHERVAIYRGRDEELESPPPLQDEKEEFYRSYIAQHILPASLARFFFFDGEQVQRLAKQDFSDQVKTGIEGLLGVTLLRRLQDDLRSYARERRSNAKTVDEEKLITQEAEVAALAARLKKNAEEQKQIRPQLASLGERRNEVFLELRTLTGGSTASLKESYDERAAHERKREQLKARLADLIQNKLCLAIAGRDLRMSVHKRVQAEEQRAKWEAAKANLQGEIGKVWAALESGPPELSPPLSSDQRTALRARLQYGWESLWNPPPTGCASGYMHPYLSSTDRARIVQRIDELDQLAIGELKGLADQIATLEKAIQEIQNSISKLQGVEPRVKRLGEELEELTKQELALKKRVDDLQRDIAADQQRMGDDRATLARMKEQRRESEPEFAKSNAAERVAEILDELIEESYPRHRAGLQQEMTRAYLAMAHKRHVKSISIEPDLTVRLLSEKGRDLKELDNSAGEDQIFALSLIAAIAKVVNLNIPIIMDTPLARLDDLHRLRVLEYFTDRDAEQVILLSQPVEVFGPYLDKIRPRISTSFLIEHEELGNGIGRNQIHPNRYFENRSFV